MQKTYMKKKNAFNWHMYVLQIMYAVFSKNALLFCNLTVG